MPFLLPTASDVSQGVRFLRMIYMECHVALALYETELPWTKTRLTELVRKEQRAK